MPNSDRAVNLPRKKELFTARFVRNLDVLLEYMSMPLTAFNGLLDCCCISLFRSSHQIIVYANWFEYRRFADS